MRKEWKALLVLVATLVALIAALAAGIVKTAEGGRLPAAVRAGAAAFAATLPLTLMVMSTMGMV